MSLLLRRPLIAALVGALLAVAVIAGAAWASSNAPKPVAFTGCLALESGRMSAVAIGDKPAFPCPKDVQQVSWEGQAVVGINGDNGELGPTGSVGPPGSTGPVGQPGQTGTQGLFGPTGPTGARGADGRDAVASKDGKDGGDGKNGADGKNGFDGKNGLDGKNGNVTLSGSGPPSAGGGNVGDLYLDQVAGKLYGPKTDSGWGTGLQLVGADGTAVLSGAGRPDATLGKKGDFYVDLASPERFLYGPRAETAWPEASVRLVGEPGLAPAGAVVFFNTTDARCPAGWVALEAAQGRTIVGMNPAGTMGQAVGNPLTDAEDRTHTHTVDPAAIDTAAAGAHNHRVIGMTPLSIVTVRYYAAISNGSAEVQPIGNGVDQTGFAETVGGHSHPVDVAATPASASSSGIPYLQLLACQKT